MTTLLVVVGGALGAAGRFLVDRLLSARGRGRLPVGTLCVNLLGSLALGLAVGSLVRSGGAYALLATGVCGAFTTWSTLAVEISDLLRTRPATAAAYLAATLGGGIALAFVGLVLSGGLRG